MAPMMEVKTLIHSRISFALTLSSSSEERAKKALEELSSSTGSAEATAVPEKAMVAAVAATMDLREKNFLACPNLIRM